MGLIYIRDSLSKNLSDRKEFKGFINRDLQLSPSLLIYHIQKSQVFYGHFATVATFHSQIHIRL